MAGEAFDRAGNEAGGEEGGEEDKTEGEQGHLEDAATGFVEEGLQAQTS